MGKISKKSRLIDALLCYFLGVIGVHKFYEGKIGMGILYLFTAGLFGIGVLVDLIIILVGSATDSDGDNIKVWMPDEAEKASAAGTSSYDYDFSKDANKSGEEEEKIEILKEYKDMLDNGMITQEEYDKKKREILK